MSRHPSHSTRAASAVFWTLLALVFVLGGVESEVAACPVSAWGESPCAPSDDGCDDDVIPARDTAAWMVSKVRIAGSPGWTSPSLSAPQIERRSAWAVAIVPRASAYAPRGVLRYAPKTSPPSLG